MLCLSRSHFMWKIKWSRGSKSKLDGFISVFIIIKSEASDIWLRVNTIHQSFGVIFWYFCTQDVSLQINTTSNYDSFIYLSFLFCREKNNYWHDFFNYLDLLGISSVLFLMPIRWSNSRGHWHVGAFAYMINFARIFKFYSAFRFVYYI